MEKVESLCVYVEIPISNAEVLSKNSNFIY